MSFVSFRQLLADNSFNSFQYNLLYIIFSVSEMSLRYFLKLMLIIYVSNFHLFKIQTCTT